MDILKHTHMSHLYNLKFKYIDINNIIKMCVKLERERKKYFTFIHVRS